MNVGREAQGGGIRPHHLHPREGPTAQKLSTALERGVRHRQETVRLPMDQTIAGVQIEGTGAPRMMLRRGVPLKKMVAIAALALLGTVEALLMMMKIMDLRGAVNSLRLTKYV